MPTITPEIQALRAAVAQRLATIPALAEGLGNAEIPCSIAAFNLATAGKLSDQRPDCMSPVAHAWVIVAQDYCPADLGRDHPRWRECLPLLAGTNDGKDSERLAVIRAWTYGCLARLQPMADTGGYGAEWARMCAEQTASAADDAARAVTRAAAAAYTTAAYTTAAARAAAYAAHDAARAVTRAATYDDARAAAAAYTTAAYRAAAYAAHDAARAAAYTARACTTINDFWRAADIPTILQTLVTL